MLNKKRGAVGYTHLISNIILGAFRMTFFYIVGLKHYYDKNACARTAHANL